MNSYPALRNLAQRDGITAAEAQRALDVLDCARVTGWSIDRTERYLHELALARLLEAPCRT